MNDLCSHSKNKIIKKKKQNYAHNRSDQSDVKMPYKVFPSEISKNLGFSSSCFFVFLFFQSSSFAHKRTSQKLTKKKEHADNSIQFFIKRNISCVRNNNASFFLFHHHITFSYLLNKLNVHFNFQKKKL